MLSKLQGQLRLERLGTLEKIEWEKLSRVLINTTFQNGAYRYITT
jgi:hypothetical protein